MLVHIQQGDEGGELDPHGADLVSGAVLFFFPKLTVCVLDYISEQRRSCSIWSILEYSDIISQRGNKVYK